MHVWALLLTSTTRMVVPLDLFTAVESQTVQIAEGRHAKLVTQAGAAKNLDRDELKMLSRRKDTEVRNTKTLFAIEDPRPFVASLADFA